jgi:MoaA/NifB/PqqE/SkfB family radical SAM enzyme
MGFLTKTPSTFMRSGVLFLTYKCNFTCHYCWQRQGNKVGEYAPIPFIDSKNWVNAINRLGFDILDISGGEPFLQPGFVDMLNGLNCRIGMTSNFSHPLTDFVQKIKPSKVISITASYHPSQNISLDQFIGRIALLQSKGFNVTVNFVAHPDQMYLIPSAKQQFERMGFRFHVDPYVAYTDKYEFTEEEKKFLRPYVGDDRGHYLSESEETIKMCSGGRTHLHIQPNGDAYRCYTDFVQKKQGIGNIFQEDFKLAQADSECQYWGKCLGCDKDKVSIYDKN